MLWRSEVKKWFVSKSIISLLDNELTDENEAFHEQTLEFTQTLSSSKEEIEKLTNDVTSLQMTIEDKQEELDKAQLKIEVIIHTPGLNNSYTIKF